MLFSYWIQWNFLVEQLRWFTLEMTAKQNNCQFLVLKRNIQNVAARSAWQTFVTAFIINFPCMDKETLLFHQYFPGEKASPILSWIYFCVSSKVFIPLSHFMKNELVCSSKGILRTWHVDVHWKHWQSLLPRVRDQETLFSDNTCSQTVWYCYCHTKN